MLHVRCRTRILYLLMLLLVILSCNAPGSDTPTPSATSTLAPTNTPAPTDTLTPTDTPTPTPCLPDSEFVLDVTIPDWTTVQPGAQLSKTWRVRNSGACAWKADTVLSYIAGDQMGGPASISAGVVTPQSLIDLTVSLVAPSTTGSYEGQWRLYSSTDGYFGVTLMVRITVQPSNPTPTPPCVAVDALLSSILTYAEDAGHNPGCPIGPSFVTNGAIQLFETNPENTNPHARMRGFMIWREDEDAIYALGSGWASYMPSHDGDVLHVYSNTWAEGMPSVHPDCASMQVPSGYELPTRGFGRAWCEHSLYEPTEIGWPQYPETGVLLLIQPTRNGALIHVMAHPWGIEWDFSLDIPGQKWFSTD